MNLKEYIISTSNKYHFYPKEIRPMLMFLGSPYMPAGDFKINGKRVGFYIYMWSKKKECCLKFVFIEPEYRNKGIFTKFLNILKEKEWCIAIDTEEKYMGDLLKRRGFVYKGKCLDGVSHYYRWEK